MKIGFVLDDGFDKTDGVQQYMLTLGQWLESKNHKVHYLVGHSVRVDLRNVHSLSRNLKVRFNGNRSSMPIWVDKKAVRALLEKEKFDILHIMMPYSPLLVGFTINNAPDKTSIVGTFHIAPYNRFDGLANRLFSLTLKKSLNRVDEMVSVSSAARDFSKYTTRKKSIVIPNMINVGKYSTKKITKSSKYYGSIKIIFLGRLVERKGAMQLLEAVELLNVSNKINGISLTIAGDGPLKNKLENYVKKHCLGDQVKFLGYIDEKAKPKLLASADIAVFPALGGESFGIVLIEAMAAGAGVVLAGNNPGYRFVVNNDSTMLVDPNNTAQFATKLYKLSTDKQLRKTIHSKQSRLVRNYDVNIIGPKIIDLYERNLRKKPSVR